MGAKFKKFLSNNYMNVRKKIIIFDFDGVLVNTLNVMEIAWKQVKKELVSKKI